MSSFRGDCRRPRAAFAGPGALALLLAVLLPAPASAQTAAVLPVRSGDAALAESVQTSLRDALLGGGYLILTGEPVTSAMAQTGLTTIASIDDGRRLGQVLGADVIVVASVEPNWLSLTVLHLPSGSIEAREGALPEESVNVAGTVVANLADAVRVMREGGTALPEIPAPQPGGPPVEQPPVEQPPVEQPPVEQPPVEQPPVEQPPVEQPPAEQPPPEEPPAFYAEGPFHIRVFGAFSVLLNEPTVSTANRLGGRGGLGFAYAVIPELDLGLELDLAGGQATTLDVLAGVTWRVPLSRAIDLDFVPHVALGYFQILTGSEDAAFMLRASGDLVLSLATGYALYFTPAAFSVVAGEFGAAGLYELGLGFLGSF
jgi:hypothetical protein